MLNIENLKWDSDFFGYKIGRIILDQSILNIPFDKLLEQANSASYKLLYLLSREDNVLVQNYALGLSACLVDQKITYAKSVIERNRTDTANVEIYETTTPSNALIDLALQSGEYSRFRIDENFKNQEFEKLYKTWIVNSVNRTLASEVFVVKDRDKEIGMITIQVKEGIATIGLLSVDKNYRKQALGRNLIARVEQYCYDQNIRMIHVVTQLNNRIACNFYEKSGYELYLSEKIYHLWVNTDRCGINNGEYPIDISPGF